MNTLEKIMMRVEQIQSLAYSLEGAIIETSSELKTEQNEKYKRMANLFYVLLEQLKTLENEIAEQQGHILVCDAIYVVNQVEEMKR